MKQPILIVLVLLVGLIVPSAFGYSVGIYDGSMTVNGSNMGQLQLLGEGFRLTAPVLDTASMMVCQLCSAGPQSLEAYIPVSDLGFEPSIPMILNGNATALDIRSPQSASDYLLFRSTVTVPVPAGAQLDVSAPFTMTGRLNVVGGTEVINLFGEGMATLRVYDSGGAWYRASDPGILYAFSGPAPLINPEPTSAILLGTGAAWLMRRRSRAFAKVSSADSTTRMRSNRLWN